MPNTMSGPGLDVLLARAVAAHRVGSLVEAAHGYTEVLERDPDNAEALHLLGLILHRQGRSLEALALMDRALSVDPGLVAAWSNRALALRALGRLPEAVRSLERALELRPDFPEASLNLTRFRAALGDRAGALEAASRVGGPEGLRLRAALLGEAGRWREAAETLTRALALAPGDARACCLLASAWQEAGEPNRAESAWRAALALPDAPAEAAAGLGGLLLGEGRPEEAVHWLQRALQASPDQALALALADALSLVPEPGPALGPALAALLAREGIDHQRLERVARGVLVPAAEPLLSGASGETTPEAVEALARHPLLAPVLARLTPCHPRWERALDQLRRDALARAVEGAPLPRPAVLALALHNWSTEHVCPPDPTSLDLARRLCEALPAGSPDAWPPAAWDGLAAAATALPLDAVPGAEALLAPGWESRPLDLLVRQQLAEPAEEASLEAEIPTLALSEDRVSASVRAQYEENPYPRRFGVHRRPPRPLPALVRAALRRPDLDIPWDGPVDVLVAGCGTGQHALSTAARTAGARVLAVDLSRRSLARARRMARAAGLSNLRFAQADLLALDRLDPVFHVVESVGVLHHLADPAAGLRVLRDRLLPGGLLQLGLYSQRGRREVVAARALIAAAGWPATAEGIRAARAALLALPPDHPAWPVVWSPDFYSLSGARDLLFHACEHRFTPLQLKELLGRLDLELLGFQHARPEVGVLYRQRFPHDPTGTNLDHWEMLEDEHPRLFSGMFVFWVRRR